MMNELLRRIKTLEFHFEKIDSTFSSFEKQYELEKEKFYSEIRKIMKEIEEIKKKIEEITKEIDKIKIELNRKASKTEVEEIRNMIEFLNPVKAIFITKEEAKRLIKEELQKIITNKI